MARSHPASKKPRTTTKRQVTADEFDESFQPTPKKRRPLEPIEAKTLAQTRYINAIHSHQLTFATGPAGVGKTWLCAALAAEALEGGLTEKIIVTRPAVEAGESMGFLPGTLDEKFDPYLLPFREVLNERLGKTKVDYLIKTGVIEAAPLAYMRGRTFRNAWVILDEAQNVTVTHMKMFLTRIGNDSTAIVNGDERQKDIPGPSGLTDAISRLTWIPQVAVVEFSMSDIVRSGLCQDIVSSYEK